MPAPTATFDGVGLGFRGPGGTFTPTFFPPDPNLAVGPNHIVEMVNASFAIFNKAGTAVYGPASFDTLFTGFGGLCETNNDGDPIVRYDGLAGRWVLSQLAGDPNGTGPSYECVAVSQTADPTGAYYRYSFQYANFPDYPKLAVWPDAFYVTYNLFSGGTLLGAEACGLDRTQMLAGHAATQQCFTTPRSVFGLLGADVEGPAPPAGAAERFVALGSWASPGTSLLEWTLHLDWASPAKSAFTGPTTVSVAGYAPACGGGGQCIPQQGTADTLDSLGDRLMFRFAYRNLGDHESFVASHSVTTGSTTGVRWYELRPLGANQAVYQQGTYAPSSDARWMPSAAMDRSGDIGLGFSVSSTTRHPGIHYAGRLASDPPGQLGLGEATLIDGTGSQLQGTYTRNRWGDYTAMAVDPADGCTFWYVNEYLATDGVKNWKTRLGSFKIPSCGVTAANDFSLSATPWSVDVTPGAARTTRVSTFLTAGAAQSLALSVTGLPAGATASFSPSSVASGAASTLTVTTAPSTAIGTYALSVQAAGPSATHTTPVTLRVVAPTLLSVRDTSLTEGNSGTPAAAFTVTRSGDVTGTSSVQVATLNGTATAGSDYTTLASTTLSFAAGQTTKTVAVPVKPDTVFEPDEAFSLRLSAPVGASLADDTGVATIRNDDPSVTFAVGDTSVTEGNSGTPAATFTVTRAGNTAAPVSVSYATINGTAVAGSDYTAVPATTLSFAAGETTKTVPVPIKPDTVFEPDETFSLRLTNPVGAVISDDTGVGTIVNDDPAASLSVNDISLAEGSSGTPAATFTVTRAGNAAAPVSVSYATVNGTATAGSDYTAVPATTLTFAAGETTKTVPVPIKPDTVFEPDETFSLRLTNPVGAVISDDTGSATLVNDDARVYLAASDVVVTEGTGGSTTAAFTVTRTGATTGPVSVTVSTSNGTATAGSDYTALPTTTLSFAAGETTKTVPVTVTPDSVVEPNETFLLRLTNPSGAAVSDDTGVATIVDDDGTITPGPVTFLAVDDLAVTEGSSGTPSATFTVRRTGNVAGSSTVNVSTLNGSAVAGSDYTALPATAVTFAAGATAKTVTVPITPDTRFEPNETFLLRLAQPSGATISDDTGVATIVNDDPLTTFTVNDVSVTEGSSGSASGVFTVSRTGSTAGPVSVTVSTVNGTAVAGSDYTALAPTVLTFAAGATTKTVSVPIHPDAVWEPNETVLLRLSNPASAVVADDTGVATIVNDDPLTTFAVNDVFVTEGSSGTTAATFTVTRSGSSAGPASVTVATSNGTATVGSDYTALAPTVLNFAVGETSKTVTASVTPDTVWEPNETFNLRLTNPVAAAVTDDTGVATIVDDDPVPYLAVGDLWITEGTGGTTDAVFTVTRSGATTAPVTVTVATSNGTATAGSDYTAVPPTVISFAAGETTKTMSVHVTTDAVLEPNETFNLRLTNPAGAVVSDATGIATIVNDDT